jgi:hypothetical protein
VRIEVRDFVQDAQALFCLTGTGVAFSKDEILSARINH